MYIRQLIFWSVLFLLFNTASANSAPPIPTRIGGSVMLDNEMLQQVKDQGIVFEVVRDNGKSFSPAAIDNDGLNDSNWYVIDIPSYDPKAQPYGGKAGDIAVIQVEAGGKLLKVISPTDGRITVGAPGSTIRVDLVVIHSSEFSTKTGKNEKK